MSVFQSQSYLTISLETGIDLSTATRPEILFVRPDGTKGKWTGTVSGTKITYNLKGGDINQVGNWRFQAKCIIDSRVALGGVANQVFQTNLQ